MKMITILGHPIAVSFQVGDGGEAMDEETIFTEVEKMADLINSKDWPDDLAHAYKSMKGIVFFDGKVNINGYMVDRPGTDEDDAIFYWEAEEFLKNPEIDVHANIFFHDCWHVVQFQNAGYAAENERVGREVDAITRQIEAGKILGNDEREIAFLENFKSDQQKIIDRLKEGVEKGVAHEAGGPRKP